MSSDDEYDLRTLEIDTGSGFIKTYSGDILEKDAKVVRKFSDLDFNFIPHPVSKDILPLRDRESVKRSFRNLIFTGIDERPFSSGLGSNIRQLLFEPMTPMTQLTLEITIRDIVRLKEPRVKIIELLITMNEDANGYDVYIMFAIDNLSEVIPVNFFLERLR